MNDLTLDANLVDVGGIAVTTGIFIIKALKRSMAVFLSGCQALVNIKSASSTLLFDTPATGMVEGGP